MHEVVRAALGVGLEDGLVDLDRGVGRGLVDVVVLQEHGRRQHDVGHAGGVGQELLVHGREQVRPREAAMDLAQLGRHAHRVGVLDQEGRHRRAAAEVGAVAAEDRADAGLVEQADGAVEDVQALDHRLVPAVELAEIVERSTARVRPGAGDDRQAGGGVHGGGTVARAGEAVAEAEIGCASSPP